MQLTKEYSIYHKHVLSIVDEYPFTATVRDISNNVLGQPYSGQVWKAITCPGEIPGQTDYRLWVEPGLSGKILPQTPCHFKVDKCTPFLGNSIEFSHGVSIKVSAIPPA